MSAFAYANSRHKNEKADDNVNDEDEGVISDYESKAEM